MKRILICFLVLVLALTFGLPGCQSNAVNTLNERIHELENENNQLREENDNLNASKVSLTINPGGELEAKNGEYSFTIIVSNAYDSRNSVECVQAWMLGYNGEDLEFSSPINNPGLLQPGDVRKLDINIPANFGFGRIVILYEFIDENQINIMKITEVTLVRGDEINDTGVPKLTHIPLYWIGGTGLWSDGNNWSLSTGGSAASVTPNQTSPVIFDANSFSMAGQSVTVDVSSSCYSIDWTGAAYNPIFRLNANLSFYGDVTFISDMSMTTGGSITYFNAKAFDCKVTTNGLTIVSSFFGAGGAGYEISLQDDLNVIGSIQFFGIITTNNHNITSSGGWGISGSQAILNAGTSTINASVWSYTGSGLVINPNTAKLNLTGKGIIAGNIDYNGMTINILGTSAFIDGSFTCANLNISNPVKGIDAIITAGDTITVKDTFTSKGCNSDTGNNQIVSDTPGTAATIDAASVVNKNTFLTDIIFID